MLWCFAMPAIENNHGRHYASRRRRLLIPHDRRQRLDGLNRPHASKRLDGDVFLWASARIAGLAGLEPRFTHAQPAISTDSAASRVAVRTPERINASAS